MGTNYTYAGKHIGKRSGNIFTLSADFFNDQELPLNFLDVAYASDDVIEDEYGNIISYRKFIKGIQRCTLKILEGEFC